MRPDSPVVQGVTGLPRVRIPNGLNMDDLRDIIERLRELHGDGDAEFAHGRADQLLCEALLRLQPVTVSALPSPAEEVIEAWRAVEKWYA